MDMCSVGFVNIKWWIRYIYYPVLVLLWKYVAGRSVSSFFVEQMKIIPLQEGNVWDVFYSMQSFHFSSAGFRVSGRSFRESKRGSAIPEPPPIRRVGEIDSSNCGETGLVCAESVDGRGGGMSLKACCSVFPWLSLIGLASVENLFDIASFMRQLIFTVEEN